MSEDFTHAPSGQQSFKDSLYGDFRDGERARRRIYNRAAMKAYDLADEEMGVNTTVNRSSGVGALGAIGIALAASVGPLALAGWLMFHPNATPSNPLPTTPAPTVPIQPPANAQKDGYWREEQYQTQPDGSEKIIGVIHYRSKSGVVEQLMPDGTWKAVGTK